MKHQNHYFLKPSLEEIARALGGEISGRQVVAPGPGHSREDRSLSITLSDAPPGYVVHSFAGDDPIECKDYVRQRLGQPAWQPNGGNGYDRDPVVASYIYRTADGKPYLRVQRTAATKFWQQHANGLGWEKGAPKGPRIPYRLPELLAADRTDPVYIVEGEKDADRLASLGFVVTTTSGGSNGKWTPELNEHFAGRVIYIIPDNDEPGDKYAQRAAQHLHGVAAEVKIVELPGLGPRTPDHGPDVSDWLDAGNQPENLSHIAEKAPAWEQQTPKDGWRAHVFTAASLKEKKFDPISYVVPMLIPEGVTILAGRPKVGKSWAALDIALALASGGYVLGEIKLEEGDVLCAALEDNERRLRARIERLLTQSQQKWPPRLTLATRWRRLDAGGVADAKEWAASVKKPRLIIFDTLAGVRGDRNNKDTTYEGDYKALLELQKWAGEAGIGILILHHTRKMEAEDPVDSVSGTLGLAGCVDTIAILGRTGKGTTLYIRGRDVEEQEKALAFNKTTCRWTILGEAEEVLRSDIRQKIVTVLGDVTNCHEAISPKDLADLCDTNEPHVRKTLGRMLRDGEILKVSRGRYISAKRDDLVSLYRRPKRHNPK
jgi:AAA domain-containing protein/Toprim domain-containing protein